VPVGVPTTLVAGDSATFDVPAISDPRGTFSSADGYLATLEIVGPYTRITLTGSTQDSGWRFALTTSESAGLSSTSQTDPVNLRWSLAVSLSGDRFTLLSGVMVLKPDPSALASYRSTIEAQLAEVRSAIADLLAGRVSSYTIGAHSFTLLDLPTLRKMESSLAASVGAGRRGGMQSIEVTFNGTR